MATAPSDRGPVRGRLDGQDRLISADQDLVALQVEAGSHIGSQLALPQIMAIDSVATALTILSGMVGMHGDATAVLPTVKIIETLVCIGALFGIHAYMRNRTIEDVVASAQRSVLLPATWAAMVFTGVRHFRH